MRGNCPDRDTCSRLGGICQCAEQESRQDSWPPGISPAYTRLRRGTVARTVQVANGAMVDVDARGFILGIETLDRGADWRDALAALAMSGRLAIPRERAFPGDLARLTVTHV